MFPIRKILVPVDFTDACRRSARFAIDLASDWDAEVCILHVLEPFGSAVGFETAVMMEEMRRAQKVRAERELLVFLNLPEFTRLRRVLREGEAAAEIVNFAREEHFDLIVMPTRGYGKFRRLLLGSVTAKVLKNAECPVWTGLHPETSAEDSSVTVRRIACAVGEDDVLNVARTLAEHWHSELEVIEGAADVTDPLHPDLLVIGRRDASTSLLREAHCPVLSV